MHDGTDAPGARKTQAQPKLGVVTPPPAAQTAGVPEVENLELVQQSESLPEDLAFEGLSLLFSFPDLPAA